jgi:hypothetical protein
VLTNGARRSGAPSRGDGFDATRSTDAQDWGPRASDRVRLSGGPRLLGSSSTLSRAHGWPCPMAGKLSPRRASCGHHDGVYGQHNLDEWMKKGGERREYWAPRG